MTSPIEEYLPGCFSNSLLHIFTWSPFNFPPNAIFINKLCSRGMYIVSSFRPLRPLIASVRCYPVQRLSHPAHSGTAEEVLAPSTVFPRLRVVRCSLRFAPRKTHYVTIY